MLKILPNTTPDENALIECYFTTPRGLTHWVQDYAALSYTWGTADWDVSSQVKDITVNGELVCVRRNLYHFLICMRQEKIQALSGSTPFASTNNHRKRSNDNLSSCHGYTHAPRKYSFGWVHAKESYSMACNSYTPTGRRQYQHKHSRLPVEPRSSA